MNIEITEQQISSEVSKSVARHIGQELSDANLRKSIRNMVKNSINQRVKSETTIQLDKILVGEDFNKIILECIEKTVIERIKSMDLKVNV